MSTKLQINTRVRRLIHYIGDLESGLLQIPVFQRDFIWTNKSKLDLFDSLRKVIRAKLNKVQIYPIK